MPLAESSLAYCASGRKDGPPDKRKETCRASPPNACFKRAARQFEQPPYQPRADSSLRAVARGRAQPMPDDPLNPWTTLGTEARFEDPWIRVEQHEVINAAGIRGSYGVVRFKKRGVGVVPIDAEG